MKNILLSIKIIFVVVVVVLFFPLYPLDDMIDVIIIIIIRWSKIQHTRHTNEIFLKMKPGKTPEKKTAQQQKKSRNQNRVTKTSKNISKSTAFSWFLICLLFCVKFLLLLSPRNTRDSFTLSHFEILSYFSHTFFLFWIFDWVWFKFF